MDGIAVTLKSYTTARAAGRLTACLVGVILLLCATASSIAAQYNVKVLRTDDGLPQNSVMATLQTRDGRLWLATNDGLASFDGRQFKVYDKSNTPGLCCNRLTALFEDSQGKLWIGSDLNTIIRFDGKHFNAVELGGKSDSSIVFSFQEDGAGNLLVNTLHGVYRGRDNNFNLIAGDGAYNYIDSKGTEWRFSNGWLNGGQGRRFPLKPGDGGIRSMLEDRKGYIWIGANQGLYLLKNGAISKISFEAADSRVYSIREDNEGMIWVGADSGLYRLQPGPGTRFNRIQGLPGANIRSIWISRDSLIWVGTNNHGLIRLNKTIISTISKADGLPSDIVYPIFEDSKGKVWIGSWPNTITILENGRLTPFECPDKTGFDHPIGFNEDKAGAIWIATLSRLWRYRNGRLEDLNRTLPGGMNAFSILPDDNGSVWLGTNRGLVKWTDKGIRIHTATEGLADGDIHVLLKDRDDGIWIGTPNGLSLFKDGRFRTWTVIDGLGSNHIRALHEDEEGAIWVGTFDGGLSRIKDGRIFTFTREQGLFCKGAFTILNDDHDNFWMSCNWGIYRIKKSLLRDFADGRVKSIISIPYGREDGMSITECNGGAQFTGIRTRDGRLMIPTMGGVAVIDPRGELINPALPPLVIDEVFVGDNIIDADARLSIEPSESNIEIHYDALSYFKPEKVRFRYMMSPLDRTWINVGDQRTAYYPYLPPGDYQFRLSASYDGGNWYETGRNIAIFVPEPFYNRWWFRLTMLSVMILGGVYIYRRNMSKVIRQGQRQLAFSRKLLGSLEVERRKIARELHDGVVNNLASVAIAIHNLSKQINGENPELKRKMIDIHDQTMGLTQNVRTLSHLLHPAPLEHFGLPAAIRSICKEFGESTKLEIELFLDENLESISPEADICIYRIIQEALRNIVKHSQAANVLISLRRIEKHVELIVSDNGIGFDRSKSRDGDGFGLISIQERLDGLGGNLAIDSVPGRGSDIIATIPMVNKNQHYHSPSS
ncbi:MAG: two-component regulator propeller domain-containing protein [Blastocatellales bacterium]